MKTLTVIAPVYNEADGIQRFYDALKVQLAALPAYKSRMLFVVDGGSDNSFEILRNIAREDDAVSVVKLSRNFGHQAALLAGIDAADADVIITMDSDMQHPPEVIRELLSAYENGSDIVYTFRDNADDVGFLRRIAGTMFYSVVNIISDIPVHRNASDFRLISRRVALVIQTAIRERNMFMRGIMSWVGFPQSSVRFKANDRYAGKSKYTLSRNLQFATFGLISFSKKPLRAATLVGLLVALVGLCFAAYTVFQYFTSESLVPGWATTVVLLSVFGGIQLFFLGIIGEYIGAIFDEVKGRPHYIVEESVNMRS